jgi:hypothetical protein
MQIILTILVPVLGLLSAIVIACWKSKKETKQRRINAIVIACWKSKKETKQRRIK